MSKEITKTHLLPAENLALTVARAQVARGENPPINITTALVLALNRLTDQEPTLINPTRK